MTHFTVSLSKHDLESHLEVCWLKSAGSVLHLVFSTLSLLNKNFRTSVQTVAVRSYRLSLTFLLASTLFNIALLCFPLPLLCGHQQVVTTL